MDGSRKERIGQRRKRGGGAGEEERKEDQRTEENRMRKRQRVEGVRRKPEIKLRARKEERR